MFQNYLTTAIRNLWKDKTFSIINISGLAIGLASVMLITLYSWDEVNFDSMYPGTDNVYKIELAMQRGSRPPRRLSNTGGAIAPTLANEASDIVDISGRLIYQTQVVTVGEQSQSLYVGHGNSTFFDVFKVEWVASTADNPLTDLTSVVINETTSNQLFGSEPALGKTIDLDNGKTYRVTGVMKDLPRNTHLDLSIIFASEPNYLSQPQEENGWWNIGFRSYIKLHEGKTIEDLKARVPALIEKYIEPSGPNKKSSDEYCLTFIPLEDVHFETAANDRGDKTLLTGFLAIAGVILAIATFNFMNMSLSRTIIRAREVAVRKSLGATRKNIIHQFLGEAVVTTLAALIIALAITELSLPFFNQFVAKLMSSGTLATPLFMGGMVAIVGIVGLGSGYYPATIMAGFNPAEILRGGRANSKKLTIFRTALVTLQFSVAIGLIISSTIIYNQINYTQSMDPGFTKENVLVINDIDHSSVLPNRFALMERLRAHPDIVNLGFSDSVPGGTYGWMTGLESINNEPVTGISLRGVIVDDNYFPTMDMTLVAGRNFNAELDSDYSRRIGGDWKESSIILNETAVRSLGLGTPEEAIGKTINDGTLKTVVGVVKDFLMFSARSPIQPTHYIMDEQEPRMLSLRYKTNDLPGLIKFVDDTWSSIMPNRPIRKSFLDDHIASQYNVEEHQGDIFTLFAGLAVIVSCIGLYGLASLTVDRRTKEMGLRKVLGANVTTITKQVLWDFSKPVILANVIAWPLAFYFMSGWLEKFVYRIELGFTPFLVSGTLAVIIAWITVGSHAIRVARTNPIKALRYE